MSDLSNLLELVGVWVAGPPDPLRPPPPTAKQLRVPRGSNVVIRVRLIDQLWRPVALALASGDSLVLAVGGADAPVLRAVAAASATDASAYDFTLAPADTKKLYGRLLYDVWATKGGLRQQVVAPSYWDAGIRVVLS